MYQLFDDSDEVYKVTGTNIEIILTSSQKSKNRKDEDVVKSGITFYANNFKYQSIHISEAIAAGERDMFDFNSRPQFDNILQMLSKSKNSSAKAWIDLFKANVPGEVWYNDRISLNQELNNFEELSERLQSILRKQAISTHTSLLKSLDIIAARIPAQNQQSFMPMKVVAWDNPNINTAYVSVMQFFLQGSDLDIDAVSLLTYSFSESGEFYSWSPDFNMSNIDMLNLSMNLPFPSGNKLQTVAYDDPSKPEVRIEDRKPSLLMNRDFQALAEYEIAKNDPNSTKIFDEKVLLQHYINLLEFIENSKGIIYVEKQSDLDNIYMKAILERINTHNTYLNNLSDTVATGAIKNYIVNCLHSISTDAANLLEAHTGVDVATGPFKKIANASELSEVQKTFTPGNVFNKFQAIEEASVGKDDIAICATGLKSFFAAT
jgi:hypothetical protein